jgi:putative ABC transport system substrate-binding protein
VVGGATVARIAVGTASTGFTVFDYGFSAKWVQLLKEIAPQVTRAAVIRDPAIVTGIGQFAAMQSVAPALGIELRCAHREGGQGDRAGDRCIRPRP